MFLNHVLPIDDVVLKGFVRIDHSPISDIYLSVGEFNPVCKPNDIMGLKFDFPARHAEYGVSHTIRRSGPTPAEFVFESAGSILTVLNQLLKDLSDGTNLYLFRYVVRGLDEQLPKGCLTPPESTTTGLRANLIAVIRKT